MKKFNRNVFRKRYNKKRAGFKRKRAYSRLTSTRKVYTFVRSFVGDYIQILSQGNTAFDKSFSLSECPNYTEWTNLFDEYMLYKVKIRFEVLVNNADIDVAAANSFPHLGMLYTAIDKTSTPVPTSENAVLEYASCKSTIAIANKSHIRTVYPCQQTPVFRSNLATSGYKPTRGFISSGYADVPHWGIIGYFAAGGGDITKMNITIRPVITYTIKCRNVR